MIDFKNTYSKLPEKFYEKVNPASFSSPKLLKFNHELACELGIDSENIPDDELAKVFSGQKILEGSEPLAQAYAAHQFGHWVPQLGDGRAHLLGEVKGFDVQLKGSGQTRFSRRGDGRSALGPVIREYLVSEAMHFLGVPTTRALAAVATGEEVIRQMGPEPGGVFTRVASSHLRVGTFQYFASREDHEAIETLLNYSIERHYPNISKNASSSERAISFLKEVAVRQAELVGRWTSLGFIHGVMNTDNFSIAGITIDFGPCAFMDQFNKNMVYSSIDHQGRYSFFNQVPIAQWNILRLADSLLPLIDSDIEKAAKKIEEEIVESMQLFPKKRWEYLGKKLGIANYEASDEALIQSFLEYLEKESLDFTNSFRNLPALYEGEEVGYPACVERDDFIAKWKERVGTVEGLDTINPLYIPRNHLVQKVIDGAYGDDLSLFHELIEVYKSPYEEKSGLEAFTLPPKPDEIVHQTFCGT